MADVQRAAEQTIPPLKRWERAFEHPVALFIIPVFALANAGVPIEAARFRRARPPRFLAVPFLGGG